jgi:hypothetical protein
MKRILRICIRHAIAKEICNLLFNVMDVDVKLELSQASNSDWVMACEGGFGARSEGFGWGTISAAGVLGPDR